MLKTFSHDDLAAAFRHIGPGAFFVQVGAMDGITFDPVHPFVKEMQWRGILVEPVPDMFEKLRQTYAGHDGLILINKAIAEFNGTIDITRIDPEAVAQKLIGTGALGVSTIMPERGDLGNMEKLKPQTREAIEKYKRVLKVPCCRLPDLLAENKVEHIDLVVIDAEGADWMIAKQLPLERYHPRVIYLEYNHLPEDERNACVAHFTQAGYRIRLDAHNQENLLAEMPE